MRFITSQRVGKKCLVRGVPRTKLQASLADARTNSAEDYAQYENNLLERRIDLLAERPPAGRNYRYVSKSGVCIRDNRFLPDRRPNHRKKLRNAKIEDALADGTWMAKVMELACRDDLADGSTPTADTPEEPNSSTPSSCTLEEPEIRWVLRASSTHTVEEDDAPQECSSTKTRRDRSECRSGASEPTMKKRLMVSFKYDYLGPVVEDGDHRSRSPSPPPPPYELVFGDKKHSR